MCARGLAILGTVELGCTLGLKKLQSFPPTFFEMYDCDLNQKSRLILG